MLSAAPCADQDCGRPAVLPRACRPTAYPPTHRLARRLTTSGPSGSSRRPRRSPSPEPPESAVSRSVPYVLATLALALVPLAGGATGPGGWSNLGTGAQPTSGALNGIVHSLNPDAPGGLLVGGDFTDAGGDPNADYIARWDGQAWKALGASKLTGAVQ